MLRYRRSALGRTLEGNHEMQHENLIDESPPPEVTRILRARLRASAAGRPVAEKKLRVRLFKV
jgi:hypothetical protein